MNDDDEIMPLDEVKQLKKEISELKKDKEYAPSSVVARSLERLAESLERLFKIFEVAATDIEEERIAEQSFEDKIQPLLKKMEDLEQQNKDIAEGLLALADVVKENNEKNSLKHKIETYPSRTEKPKNDFENGIGLDNLPSMENNPSAGEPKPLKDLPPLPGSQQNNRPGVPPPMPPPSGPGMPPPPKPEKKGLFKL